MPTYDFLNTKTNEEFTEMMSISSKEEFIENNPHIKQIIKSAPSFSYSGKSVLSTAGDGWKDVQNKIKSGMPKRYADKIKTK